MEFQRQLLDHAVHAGPAQNLDCRERHAHERLPVQVQEHPMLRLRPGVRPGHSQLRRYVPEGLFNQRGPGARARDQHRALLVHDCSDQPQEQSAVSRQQPGHCASVPVAADRLRYRRPRVLRHQCPPRPSRQYEIIRGPDVPDNRRRRWDHQLPPDLIILIRPGHAVVRPTGAPVLERERVQRRVRVRPPELEFA